MNEQMLIDWFAAHPFIRNELLLALGAVSTYVRVDWENFKNHKAGDPEASFLWRVALRTYSKAIVIAVVPPLAALFWKILGA